MTKKEDLTVCIGSRLSSLNTSHRHNDRIILLKKIKTDNAYKLEKAIHTYLAELRDNKRREFFYGKFDDIAFICDKIARNDLDNINNSIAKMIELMNMNQLDELSMVDYFGSCIDKFIDV